jgi:DUF1680 family protein
MKSKKKWVRKLFVCILAVMMLTSLTPMPGAFAALPDSTGAVNYAGGNIARAPGVTVEASYYNTTNGAAGTQGPRIIDGTLGTNAGSSWNSWNTNAFPVTVMLTWPQPYLMDSTRVMWWYDGTGSGSGVTLPGNVVLQYNAGTVANPVWTNVRNMKNPAGTAVTTVGNAGGGTNANNRTWNGVTFDPIITQQLRLSISKGIGTGVGIGEWEVFGVSNPTELYGATIIGDSGMYSGDEHEYSAYVIAQNLTGVGYEWTLSNDNAVIVGAANGPTVTVRGDKGGSTTLSLKVTHDSGVQEATALHDIAVTATELVSVDLEGNNRLLEDEELTYSAGVYTPNLTGVAYEWTLNNGNAVIVGSATGSTVTVKGVSDGEVTLSVKATHSSGVLEATKSFAIDVVAVKAKTYVTATAAGKAPILPKRVVLENVLFDVPTDHTAGNFDFAEEFNDSLIAVEQWDAVNPALYAADKIGTTFTVNGNVKYKGKDYPAKAEVTVNEALAAPDFNRSITSENVTFDDSFWKPKQLVNATSSFDAAFVQLSSTSSSWAEERNFVNAKARLTAIAQGNLNPPMGVYSGYVFADTDVYKTMEGVAYNLAAIWDDPTMDTRKVELQDKLDFWIDLIESIQYADGYINSAFSNRTSVSSGGAGTGYWRWRYFQRHEMYNIGHFLEGAVAYTRYREGVGLPDYLLYEVGKRAADHIVEFFGPNGKRVEVPGHEEVELALMKMANLVEEYEGVDAGEKYRETVKQLVDRRGRRTGADARQSGYNGGTYSQDATPLLNETKAVGHAVRAMYFYTGVTDVATWLNQKDPAEAAPYLAVMDTIWQNASERNTYITGGIGSSQPGSSSEGFGSDYALSNHQSYCEICAAIAMSNWNQRLNLVHEDAKYADSYEKALYNGVLVGVNLAGGRFFYSTQIERQNTGASRHLWESVACCEPNVLRTIANMGGYLYTVKQSEVFVNMYAGSTASVNVEGTDVQIDQETDYPWDGVIEMTVTPDTDKAFTMNIRIPGWLKAQKYQEVKILIDGEKIDSAPSAKGYVSVTRTWPATGTVIDMDIPMEVRITEPDNNVHNIGTATHSNRNRIAIERGPIVYCLEDAGTATTAANTFNATQVVFPRTMELTPVWRADLLRGVVALSGTAVFNGEAREVTLTPYYSWNNRGTNPANLGNGDTNGSGRMVIWANATESTVQIRGQKDTLDPDDTTSLTAIPHINFANATNVTYRWSTSGPVDLVGEPVVAQAPTAGYEKIGGVVGGVASNNVTYYSSTATLKALGGGTATVTVEMLGADESVISTDTYEIAVSGETWIDKRDLQEKYDEVNDAIATNALKAATYTAKTWNALIEALDYVTALLADDDALQLEVDIAEDVLADAYAALTVRPFLRLLMNEVEDALDIIGAADYEAAYRADKRAAFEEALANAQEVIDAPEDFTDTGILNRWSALQSAVLNLFTAADSYKDELEWYIDFAEAMLNAADADKYIPAAVANLEAAIEAAQEVLDDDAATIAEVNAETEKLKEVIWQMYVKGDKTDLQVLFDRLSAYDEDKYTPASWADFEDALEYAEYVLDNVNAVDEDVQAAIDELIAADAALEFKNIVDFTALRANVETGQAILNARADYITSTIVGLPSLVASGNQLLTTPGATQAQVNAANAALRTAIAGARLKPEKSPLLAALNAARPLNFSLYTDDSVQALNALLNEAQSLLAKDDVAITDLYSDKEIEALANKILAAIAGLTEKPSAGAPVAPPAAPILPPVAAAPGAGTPVATGSDTPLAAAPGAGDTIFADVPTPAGSGIGDGFANNAAGDRNAIADNAVPQASGSADESIDSVWWLPLAAASLMLLLAAILYALVRRKKEGKSSAM